jgi:hypothetical protein
MPQEQESLITSPAIGGQAIVGLWLEARVQAWPVDLTMS